MVRFTFACKNSNRMKNLLILLFALAIILDISAQGRDVNKRTLEQTYSYREIKLSLRAKIDSVEKTAYFKDEFFNAYLKNILLNKKYSEKEKVQLFYLMQKKVGYAFVGIDYVPPKQSYFTHHAGKIFLNQNTKKYLAPLKYKVSKLLQLVDSNIKKDAVLAGNALLLASMLNDLETGKKLETYSQSTVIRGSKNSNIFNHYLCLSASLVQNKNITDNLIKNLMSFQEECMLEDILCAIYSRDNFVTIMKNYILAEKNESNDLSIETALCALEAKVPKASVQKSIESLIFEGRELWKVQLCKDLLDGKIPYNYALSKEDQLVTKQWEGVSQTIYNNGVMILNGNLMEFDPN